MSAPFDLHAHSTASDGTLAPGELVRQAAAAGVGTLALTDHDTLEGVAEAAAVAAEVGITLVPGVEISVTWEGGTVHLVGLQVDPECDELQRGLARLREFRDWRAREIGRRLARDAGVNGAFEGALALSNGRLVSRTHFARYLVAQGRAESVRAVFGRFLKQGKPGHVPGQWAELAEAVGWIRAAGGQAVLAHPARYPLSRSKLRRLLREFVAAGGVGLEVVSGSHSLDDVHHMARHAQDFRLLASAGSDYHGPEQSWLELGRLPALPPGCRPIWADWALAA
jgi:predicted metal-dependent phosphoesterase TrpH